MARIRAARQGNVLRVTISGRLGIDDMGRLEHACAPALTSDQPNLELDLHSVTDTDATAAAVVERIGRRGARIVHSLHRQSPSGTEWIGPDTRAATRIKKR
jgi:hypothetical protein